MKKKLTNNLGLKLLSLFVSFAVWLLVVNIDDPVISTTYSGISVEFINAEALTEQGKTYEILDETDVINVTVTGTRSIVETIGKENIRAVADLSNISYTGKVEITLSTNKNYGRLDSLKADVSSVSLNIENLKTVHLPINIAVIGEPADGYVVGDIQTNQNTIKVSGPESIISSVAKAEIEVSVGARTSDITTTSDIRLYDAEGEIIESPYITANLKNVNISAAILPTKQVSVEYNYSGNPAPGYMVAGDPKSDYKSVYIAGKQTVLDQINSIVVPASAIDVEGISDEMKVNVNLSRYIPEGVRFADSEFGGNVSVVVDVEKTVEKTYSIPVENISVSNLPAGYEAEVLVAGDEDDSKEYIKIKTVGVLSAMNELTGAMIPASVDVDAVKENLGVEELSAGTYQMELILELPDKVLPAEVYYIAVRLTKAE